MKKNTIGVIGAIGVSVILLIGEAVNDKIKNHRYLEELKNRVKTKMYSIPVHDIKMMNLYVEECMKGTDFDLSNHYEALCYYSALNNLFDNFNIFKQCTLHDIELGYGDYKQKLDAMEDGKFNFPL